MADTLRCEPLADDTLLLQLGAERPPIDPACVHRVHALMARIEAAAPAWLQETVPAYASLALCFDPALIDSDGVQAWLQALLDDEGVVHEGIAHTGLAHAGTHATRGAQARALESLEVEGRIVEIPVRYGGADGVDLQAAADELGLSAEALIARHTAPLYTVAMLGFAPGFPYLLGLDPALQLPRLASPRTRVPAGSVGIGGAQTGIYPHESPGGWRLIGRTPLRLFDPERVEAPALLAPGDRVRFVAITGDEALPRQGPT